MFDGPIAIRLAPDRKPVRTIPTPLSTWKPRVKANGRRTLNRTSGHCTFQQDFAVSSESSTAFVRWPQAYGHPLS